MRWCRFVARLGLRTDEFNKVGEKCSGIGAGDAAGGRGGMGQHRRGRQERGQIGGKQFHREVALRDHRCGAGVHKCPRIRALMIVDRPGQRNKHRRPAGDRKLGHAGRACARDHQMRCGKPVGHVGEKWRKLGADAGKL